eukprot:365520-Chlamydomonas_euryale.AAC.13
MALVLARRGRCWLLHAAGRLLVAPLGRRRGDRLGDQLGNRFWGRLESIHGGAVDAAGDEAAVTRSGLPRTVDRAARMGEEKRAGEEDFPALHSGQQHACLRVHVGPPR